MWLAYAFITIFGYAGMDFFIKKASGRIDDFLGTIIINFFALLPAVIMYIWLRISNQEILFTKDGAIYSIFAGIFIGIGSITLIKMFSLGSNLSIGSPVVRIGTVILTILLGIIFLNESFSIKQIIGIILAIAGTLLLILK